MKLCFCFLEALLVFLSSCFGWFLNFDCRHSSFSCIVAVVFAVCWLTGWLAWASFLALDDLILLLFKLQNDFMSFVCVLWCWFQFIPFLFFCAFTSLFFLSFSSPVCVWFASCTLIFWVVVLFSVHTLAVCSVCLYLWWHLMCHVVHYHYQHVVWLLWLYSPDLLPTSVFALHELSTTTMPPTYSSSFLWAIHLRTIFNDAFVFFHGFCFTFHLFFCHLRKTHRIFWYTLHNSHKWCRKKIRIKTRKIIL